MKTTTIKITIISAFTLIFANLQSAQAQLATERPGFSSGTSIIEAPQFEGGYTYTEQGDTNTHSIGDGVLRIPVTSGLEARLASLAFLKLEGSNEGLINPALEGKLKLFDSTDGKKQLALIAGSTIPVGDDNIVADSMEPSAKLAWSNAFAENWSAIGNVNFNLLDTGDNHRWNSAVSINLSRTLSQFATAFIESYATIPIEQGGHIPLFVVTGAAFPITDKFQLDLYGGKDTDTSDSWFISAGLAFAL